MKVQGIITRNLANFFEKKGPVWRRLSERRLGLLL
jgi:hypothetical protein